MNLIDKLRMKYYKIIIKLGKALFKHAGIY